MKGVAWALCSVMLVSVAQLLLRHAMVSLPPATDPVGLLIALRDLAPGAGALALGLAGYVISMGCWYQALHHLAFSKAYALLSLSYILVWGVALLLPGSSDSFSWQGLAGICFIIPGVWMIFLPTKSRRR